MEENSIKRFVKLRPKKKHIYIFAMQGKQDVLNCRSAGLERQKYEYD